MSVAEDGTRTQDPNILKSFHSHKAHKEIGQTPGGLMHGEVKRISFSAHVLHSKALSDMISAVLHLKSAELYAESRDM